MKQFNTKKITEFDINKDNQDNQDNKDNKDNKDNQVNQDNQDHTQTHIEKSNKANCKSNCSDNTIWAKKDLHPLIYDVIEDYEATVKSSRPL